METVESATTTKRALEALWDQAGKPMREEDDDLLGVLVRMILGQATSKQNASQAFGDLLDRFHGDWGLMARADVGEVAGAIAVGGLASQKAPRIQALLDRVREDFGEYTLEPVREMSREEALDYVLGFSGVGPTTARFTLMYAAGLDVFPINGGIRRVLERLGVLDGTESDRVAHEKAQQMLEPGDAYAAHMTLVRHARTTCTSRAPRCGECPARSVCDYAG
jgi:endonuclease-3